MAKRTPNQKAQRLVTLLLAVRFANIARALEARGLTQERLAEGWSLLRAMGDASIRLGSEPDPDKTADLLRALDKWENEFIRVAKVTLAHHHPELCTMIFADIGPAIGAEVVTKVQTFLDRIDQIADHDGGTAAIELLHERGLDPAQLDVARDLLARLESPQPAAEVDSAEAEARYRKLEDAMWQYYREWSSIARATVSSKRDLRRLGFGSETVEDPTA
jgi:hypothetical protein